MCVEILFPSKTRFTQVRARKKKRASWPSKTGLGWRYSKTGPRHYWNVRRSLPGLFSAPVCLCRTGAQAGSNLICVFLLYFRNNISVCDNYTLFFCHILYIFTSSSLIYAARCAESSEISLLVTSQSGISAAVQPTTTTTTTQPINPLARLQAGPGFLSGALATQNSVARLTFTLLNTRESWAAAAPGLSSSSWRSLLCVRACLARGQ